jgi:hypothetical protein
MSKYIEITSDTEKLFDKVLKTTSIPTWIEFKLYCDIKMKDVYKLVRCNELIHEATKGLNFILVINEAVLETLEPKQRELIIEEALCGVIVDENERIKSAPPDFTTYKGMMRKYGVEEMIKLKESVFAILDQKDEKEKEEEGE